MTSTAASKRWRSLQQTRRDQYNATAKAEGKGVVKDVEVDESDDESDDDANGKANGMANGKANGKANCKGLKRKAAPQTEPAKRTSGSCRICHKSRNGQTVTCEVCSRLILST